MGAYKGLEHEVSGSAPDLTAETVAESQALFEDFDPSVEGGLRVATDGQVFEVRHPDWATDDSQDVAKRAARLPIRLAGQELLWEGAHFNPSAPTLGCETEIAVTHNQQWHPISPDGTNLQYPDGSTGTLREHDFDPEALNVMVEYKSDVAFGYEEHRRQVVEAAMRVEQWLAEHDLQTPSLTMYPEDFGHAETTMLPYIQTVISKMASMREFGVMSNQLHVQMRDPEAAQHAMNVYQASQAVFGLLTAAAPARDGSFDTTIGQHYRLDEVTIESDDLQPATLPEHDYARLFADEVPYDWRELARVLGSPSAGTFSEAAPVDLAQVLQLADAKLRDGRIVTAGRVLGWHTDRLRFDKGTIELCNIGTAGGNLHKALAAQELAAKYLVALQEHYTQLGNSGRAAYQDLYQQSVEIGHANNIMIALGGKDTKLAGFDGAYTPTEMLESVMQFTDAYSPVPVSETTRLELSATLSTDAPIYQSADEVFQAFFRPHSPMTATDALRRAHQLEPDTPVNQLLDRYAQARREHVYDVYASHSNNNLLPQSLGFLTLK